MNSEAEFLNAFAKLSVEDRTAIRFDKVFFGAGFIRVGEDGSVAYVSPDDVSIERQRAGSIYRAPGIEKLKEPTTDYQRRAAAKAKEGK